ncbi:MAG: (2Fe-2S) ferredoxin domain-containing protein [Oscillospiraceae bacterium]|jgi:(2Fe-2S) ferredoxin|nr:(2Fe-2S) ferredoxin domain-containing protein [Oscillospiraceae bacterium]
MTAVKKHVFVCTGGKLVGDAKGMCHTRNSTALVRKLMEEIDERELSGDIMVSAVSCFGICDKGPVACVYPEGIWYGRLNADAIEQIAEEHLEGGNPVAEYQI